RRVAAVAPGQPVRLKVFGERKPVALRLTVTEMPAEEPVLAGAPEDEGWGLSVEPLSGDAAAQLGLTIAAGLLVTDVVAGSPADKAGLRRGDVIVEVGKKPVADPATLFRTLAQLKPGDRVLVLDQRMPGEPGIEVLPRVLAVDPTTVVVLVTAVREVRMAVEALKRGAYDYLTKPFDVDDILLLAQRALEKRALEREVLCLRSALA